MNTNPTEDELEALRRLDACTLANTIESFGTRLRNEGFANSLVHCLFPDFSPMVGNAATVKIRGSTPPTGARTYVDRTEWWDYVLSVPPPRVLVVQDVSSSLGAGALIGEVHVNILRALGCVGAVTNGSARDLPAIKALGFHVFAGGLSVSHSYIHVIEPGLPVVVGGLTVRSGDLLHGDMHGVQSIPRDIVAKIPAAAAELTAREKDLIALCRSRNFTLEKLRAAVGGQAR
jgi:4-hydroxy-4-methyl-2-oxoglutarate aldolase